MSPTQRTPSTRRNARQPQRGLPLTSSTPPDHIGLLVASVLMIVVGWGGLYQLVTTTLPRLGGELWLFFILLLVAVTGTVLPVVRYVNVRFTSLDRDVPPGGVIVRQSIWMGLFFVTCAWLQIPRALSLPVMIFLGAVLLMVEAFLRSRELAAERED